MKKQNNYNIYDFSDYSEITGDALYKINGGAQIENSNTQNSTLGWEQRAYAEAQKAAGKENKTWMPEENTCATNASETKETSNSAGSSSSTSYSKTSSEYHGVPPQYWESMDEQKEKNKASGESLDESSGETNVDTPVTEMQVSKKGIDFITTYEDFVPDIYDASSQRKEYISGISEYSEGDWTIGYGHKLTQEEFDSKIFETSIDETVGKKIMAKDLTWVEEGIQKNFNGSLTQQQFDALVSFGINNGRQGLLDSKPFDNAKQGITDINTIKNDFIQYNKGYNPKTKQLEYMIGLERRRYDEVEMYLYGDYIRNDDLTLDKPVF